MNEPIDEPSNEYNTLNEIDANAEPEEDMQVEETPNENVEDRDEYDSFDTFSYEGIIAHSSVNVNFFQHGFIQFPPSWISSGWSPWSTGAFTLTIGAKRAMYKI